MNIYESGKIPSAPVPLMFFFTKKFDWINILNIFYSFIQNLQITGNLEILNKAIEYVV